MYYGFIDAHIIAQDILKRKRREKEDGVNLLSVGKDERTPNETGSVLEPPTSYPFYQNASNVADLLADGQSFSDCESFECDAHPLFVCCSYELIPRVLPLYL